VLSGAIQKSETCLHEAAEAEDSVIEAALLDKLLGAGLHLHQGHLWVLLCIVDAEEDVPLDSHCLHIQGVMSIDYGSAYRCAVSTTLSIVCSPKAAEVSS